MIAFGFVATTTAAPLASSSVASLMLLYVGPDQILPLTSALAAMVGVLLMFWQRLVHWVREAWHRLTLRVRRNPQGEP